MIIEQRPMYEVVSDAIHILTSQIGAVNTARFINYFSAGFGNYTEERKKVFDKYTVDDIVKEIEEYNKKIMPEQALQRTDGQTVPILL